MRRGEKSRRKKTLALGSKRTRLGLSKSKAVVTHTKGSRALDTLRKGVKEFFPRD